MKNSSTKTIRLLWMLCLVSMTGCLSFDLTASVSPAGRLLGTTSLTAPVWLSSRWFGDNVDKTNATVPMVESMKLLWKKQGGGAWIMSDSIENYRTPFLSFRFGEQAGHWQIWGLMNFDAQTMELLEKELNRRAAQIPKVHKDRAPKLAGAMMRQAKFVVTLRTPGAVAKSDGEIVQDDVVRWVVHFEDLKANDGKAFLTVEGNRSWAQNLLAFVDRFLPSGELD